MAVSMRDLDPAFQGAGQKAGIEIWRIENFHPVAVPTSNFGKFFTGDSYIILKTLYGLGARKVALFAIGAIGCTANAVALYGTTNCSICVDHLNQAAPHFNGGLLMLVNELRLVMNATFCEVRKGEELCVPNSVPCRDRNKYIYFDSVHPTDFVNKIVAKIANVTSTVSMLFP